MTDTLRKTMKVTISGLTYDAVSGGGLFQTERVDIARAFDERPYGFGRQYVADLSPEQAAVLGDHLQGYGEFFTGGGFDADDYQTPREGRACLRDAARIRDMLDRLEEVGR